MTQFTSSAKPIQYYISAQSNAIDALAAAVGDRLERLTQCERYQLLAVVSLFVWNLAETEDGENITVSLVSCYEVDCPYTVTGNVKICLKLLNGESPDTLSDVLPSIAEYAKNYLMQPSELGDQESHEGEMVLSGLAHWIDPV